MDKGREYVIKPCAVGYGVYEKSYWYLGKKYEGLCMVSKNKQNCIDAVLKAGATYIEE